MLNFSDRLIALLYGGGLYFFILSFIKMKDVIISGLYPFGDGFDILIFIFVFTISAILCFLIFKIISLIIKEYNIFIHALNENRPSVLVIALFLALFFYIFSHEINESYVYGPYDFLDFYIGLEGSIKSDLLGYFLAFMGVWYAGNLASREWERQTRIKNKMDLHAKTYDVFCEYFDNLKNAERLCFEYRRSFQGAKDKISHAHDFINEFEKIIDRVIYLSEKIDMTNSFFWHEIFDSSASAEDLYQIVNKMRWSCKKMAVKIIDFSEKIDCAAENSKLILDFYNDTEKEVKDVLGASGRIAYMYSKSMRSDLYRFSR